MNVKVYDADMISRNDLIGHWGIDMTEVYFLPGHELYRQWVGVADEKGDVVKINGYLKLSVTFLHNTEKPVKHDIEKDLVKEEGEEKEGISSMVMMPPHIQTELQFLVLTVHSAKHLPVMDRSRIPGVTNGIDPYVRVRFGGRTLAKTRVRTQKGNFDLDPIWNEELWIPIVVPTMTKRILIQIYDHDTLSFDDKVSQVTLSLDQIRFHPFTGRYFTLYGAPHNMNSGFMKKGVKSMMQDPSKGSYFRGQILLSAKMLTHKEAAVMNLPDHVQTKRAKHLQESKHESKIVPYVFRAFMCSGTSCLSVYCSHTLEHTHTQTRTQVRRFQRFDTSRGLPKSR